MREAGARGDNASISALMALLERFAYFLVSRRLEFDNDVTLDTVTHRRPPRLLRRPRSASEPGRNAVPATPLVARARGRSPSTRRGSGPRTAHRRRRPRRRRSSAATIVAGGESCTARPTMSGCSTWFSMFWYTRKIDEAGDAGRRARGSEPSSTNGTAPRKPPICGIGLRHRDPYRDQRRERDAERERGDERDDAGERGDEQRARDVLADHLVDERAEAVGRRSVATRERGGARS